MAIVWNRPSGRFSFGQLSGAEQALYEDNSDLAFQKLMDYYGQGNPNFSMTTLGRYIASRKNELQNRFISDQSSQTTRLANEKTAWDAREQQSRWAFEDQEKMNESRYQQELSAAQQALNEYQRNYGGTGHPEAGQPGYGVYNAMVEKWRNLASNPYVRKQYTPGTYTASENPLTLTAYLEQHQDELPGGFGLLSSNMRGANPGAFQVRRNLW